VRGANDAAGHAAELVRLGPLARAHRARALAGDVVEGATEGAEALPARVERDLGDGHVRVAQQRHRALDAPREQVAVRGQPERLLERAREVRLGDAAHAGQAPDRPLLVRGRVHAVLRAQQTAQELGVLVRVVATHDDSVGQLRTADNAFLMLYVLSIGLGQNAMSASR